MNRFLIAVVSDKNSPLRYQQEVFKVSDDCSPYDVTIPEKTLFFTFVHADVETAKELAESLVTFKTCFQTITVSAVTMIPENNGKRYFVGKVIPIDHELQAIYNERANNIIPFIRLVGNDEIIDL